MDQTSESSAASYVYGFFIVLVSTSITTCYQPVSPVNEGQKRETYGSNNAASTLPSRHVATLTYRLFVCTVDVKSSTTETVIRPTRVPGTLDLGRIELTVLRL